jgi:hypothetical protein
MNGNEIWDWNESINKHETDMNNDKQKKETTAAALCL